MLKQMLLALLACALMAAQVHNPERTVVGNVLTSERDPEVRIELPKSAQYVGAARWILFDVADCELHAFVEADAQKNVQRLYWVQFEAYLPSKPKLTYEYDSPRHTPIAGMDFYVDTWVRSSRAATKPGSDREHLEALIRARGYQIPAGMMYARLVHLLDEQRRKELMIIYAEDLSPTGLSASELDEGGKAFNRWPVIEEQLIKGAKERIVIKP